MHKYNEARTLEVSDNLPKNIRQIGEVLPGTRIYIEDYVYTYLHQYAANGKAEEQVAFLIGEQRELENEKFIIINGTVQGKFLERENGNLEITEATIDYLNQKRNQYFKNYEVLGWVYTQPGYGVLLTSFLLRQHMQYFKNEGQVLFILDPIEKEELFFQSENGSIIEKQGFFIYYEKNDAMHEYMLDYKVIENKTNETQVEDIVINYRAKELEKKEEINHKKFIHMLTVLCGALILMCLVIGMGLIHNMEEMNELKQTFSTAVTDMAPIVNSREDKEEGVILDATVGQEASDTNKADKPVTSEVAEDSDVNGTGKSSETNNTEEAVSEPAENSVTQTTVSEEVLTIPETYTVLEGDNLIKISYQFYNTKDMVEKLQELNSIENPHKILVGQVLKLPQLN